jgi:hypothetical protein
MFDGMHSVGHAATALEHLAKAVLAARHPSLIAVASKDNFESLLLLVGETKVANPGAKIRTIGAREALARAGRYAPECASLPPTTNERRSTRQGAAKGRCRTHS